MLLLCFYAILVSVQCAPKDYPKADRTRLENVTKEFKKEIMHSQYGVIVNHSRFVRSNAKKLVIYTFLAPMMSEETHSIINKFLLPYVQEKTCLIFEEDSQNNEKPFLDNKYVVVFSKTNDKIRNCLDFIEGSLINGGNFIHIKLNEECIRERVEQKQAREIALTKYVEEFNRSFCQMR